MNASEFNLTRIDRLRYRPSREAEEFIDDLRRSLIPESKAVVGRLAIGRSLAQLPAPLSELTIPDNARMGQAIEGIHFLGDDADLWACLIAASVDEPPKDDRTFRRLVEAHWHRGAMLLKSDFEEARQNDVDFVIRLAGLLPKPAGRASMGTGEVVESEGPVTIRFGSVSCDFQTGEEISYALNAPGTSPHLALLGKTRSGKTRTGLDMAKEITDQAAVPLILIDPKGEFVKNGQLIAKSEWQGETLDSFFPGIQALEIPRKPLPLDFFWKPPSANHSQMAIAFKDSFQKCLRAKGDVILDFLRQSVLQLLEESNSPITLDDIQHRFEEFAEEEGKSPGSIGAKLGEINSLGMFFPNLSPAEFFSKRWVISLGDASDEPKRLVMFLLLDALNNYLMSLPDSNVDSAGNRALRHLLIVDEAREILSYRHGALSSLIRRSASKGGVVMLLSQSPDDFEQEEDDFLEQMGSIGVFAFSSPRVKNLSAAFGCLIAPRDFSDKRLPTGVALVKIPGEVARRIVAWKRSC
uniref:DNA sulfur modification protein DndE n=1 Tax=Candidatus Kentrum sp. UNK TaxID=2126344 RepID=A0A451AZ36_9GAMM|nr:MAG: DNA sulfur modification protein DndE [Candidatus Kentron sp. UNK]VFK71322.1 MAG: DNA sulfur modification protein DndE [Candidatus Kentron sp. UNK]